MLILRKGNILPLLTLLMLLCLAGCGTNGVSTLAKPQTSRFSSIPNGMGNDPEPGISNKPRPTPDGHTESILVANGVAYVGSDNGKIYAFDAINGTIRWQSKESATRLFAVDGNRLYAGDDTTNIFYALNTANGAALWQHSMDVPVDRVIVGNGIVYADALSGTSPSTIYALQATSGTVLWHYAVASVSPSLLAVSNGRVYDAPTAVPGGASSVPETVTVLDAASGRVLWQMTPRAGDGAIGGGIAESGGTVYLSTDRGSIYAVQENSGHVLWQAVQTVSDILKGVFEMATPVIVNGTVYTGNASTVFAYRASDGHLLWQYQPTTNAGPTLPFSIQPLISNGGVYFASSAPARYNLTALRASDGKVLWQSPIVGAVPGSLTLAGGLLINQIDEVTAWRISDGSKVWSHSTDNGQGPPGPGAPVLTDSSTGALYVGGSDGSLQALRVSDGQQLWSYRIPENAVQQPPVYGAGIMFSNATSYDRAIQVIGDLGLKTIAECRSTWVPEDDRDYYASNHFFSVVANTNSATLWLERLRATPEVAQVQVWGPHSCPMFQPGPIKFLDQSQAGTYLQISFSSDTAYLKAWESLNALGFRLANPCYEKERAQGHKPTWPAAGEESSFAQTHALVVATTGFNAITWRQQLQSTGGVKQVSTLSGSTCN